MEERKFKCIKCGHGWGVPFGKPRPEGCPECGEEGFRRDNPPVSSGPGGNSETGTGSKGQNRGRCCRKGQLK